MNLGLEGKIAIVTGASRGIGKAIAKELADEGCNLVLVARDIAQLDETAAEINKMGHRRALALSLDLRAANGTECVAVALNAYGRINVLVNCAGAAKRGDFMQLLDEDFYDGFALKFMSAVRLTRVAWPHLVQSKGAIVNVIGMAGRYAAADYTIAGSVNAALMNFTKAMALRGQKDGVRVNGVSPGVVESDRLSARIQNMMRDRRIGEAEARREIQESVGIARFAQPSEIAHMVCILAGTTSGYVQGALVEVSGGQGNAI